MRLDKCLADCGLGTRSEVKSLLKAKRITVNGKVVNNGKVQVNPETDEILFDGEKIQYEEFVYIMMNKPKDTVSATEDAIEKTVVDILKEEDRIHKVFPVGRLDKDTEGLMLLTNDGELAHRLITPKKDVVKKYYVEVSGELKEEHLSIVEAGVILEDGYKCKPARLEILESSENKSRANIYITEGKFHQVKRMMKSLETTVTYLKRISIGELILDGNLELGEYRYLTNEELDKLNK